MKTKIVKAKDLDLQCMSPKKYVNLCFACSKFAGCEVWRKDEDLKDCYEEILRLRKKLRIIANEAVDSLFERR